MQGRYLWEDLLSASAWRLHAMARSKIILSLDLCVYKWNLLQNVQPLQHFRVLRSPTR
jgi:hypothetical protein